MNKTDHFDLILVYTSHRRHEPYINIIKYLSKHFSIGLLKFEPKHKWGAIEESYVQKCLDSGASLVKGKSQCHTLIIPRFGGNPGSGYFKDILEDMPEYINFERVLIWPAGMLHGVLNIDYICRYLGDPVILAPNKIYFASFETEVKEFMQEHPLEVVEVGLPYAKHPVFENFSTDYMVAYPSHVAIQNQYQYYLLIKNMVSALKSLPETARVTLKPHNVRDTGNRLSGTFLSKYKIPFWFIQLLITIFKIFDFSIGSKPVYQLLPDKIISRITAIHNDYIFYRCDNLLNEYPGFGIEHFIHGIKKGLITGLSTSIIYAMFEKKPVYLCDNPLKKDIPKSYELMNTMFNMSQWKGFSDEGFSGFNDSDRSADLIEYLRKTVKKVDAGK